MSKRKEVANKMKNNNKVDVSEKDESYPVARWITLGTISLVMGGLAYHNFSLNQELESVYEEHLATLSENKNLEKRIDGYTSNILDLSIHVEGYQMKTEELSNTINELEITIDGLREENTALGKSIALLGERIANRRANVSNADINLLAQITAHEALGEPREGQKAVVHTLINRLHDDRFPNTITDIVMQPKQISHLHQALNQPVRDEMREVVIEALNEPDNTGNALFWFNPVIAECQWQNTRQRTAVFGGHVFSK